MSKHTQAISTRMNNIIPDSYSLNSTSTVLWKDGFGIK